MPPADFVEMKRAEIREIFQQSGSLLQEDPESEIELENDEDDEDSEDDW